MSVDRYYEPSLFPRDLRDAVGMLLAGWPDASWRTVEIGRENYYSRLVSAFRKSCELYPNDQLAIDIRKAGLSFRVKNHLVLVQGEYVRTAYLVNNSAQGKAARLSLLLASATPGRGGSGG